MVSTSTPPNTSPMNTTGSPTSYAKFENDVKMALESDVERLCTRYTISDEESGIAAVDDGIACVGSSSNERWVAIEVSLKVLDVTFECTKRTTPVRPMESVAMVLMRRRASPVSRDRAILPGVVEYRIFVMSLLSSRSMEAEYLEASETVTTT